MALMYFDEFERVNQEREAQGLPTLKVGVTFSMSTNNSDNQLTTNDGLLRAMNHYNKMFGTNFGLDDVSGYTQDLTTRLNRTAEDGQYLDIVIVVDQLLTGFDAPKMNTLYAVSYTHLPIARKLYYRLLSCLIYYLLYPLHPLVLEFGPQ